jgi:hypothetical protein
MVVGEWWLANCINNQQPAANDQEPATNDQQPATNNQQR